jgi:uncharacterized protein
VTPRIVLDSNVIVSALISPGGTPARIFRARLAEGRLVVVTSHELLAELRAVLNRERLRPRFPRGHAGALEALRALESSATIVDPAIRLAIVRDEADNRVVEAAVAGAVGYIVSGDTHLLSLGEASGIRLVSPVERLPILEDEHGN